MARLCCLLLLLWLMPFPINAQQASLFAAASGSGATPLIGGVRSRSGEVASASLFSPDARLFAPIVPKAEPAVVIVPDLSRSAFGGQQALLLDLIATAEAGPLGYDAVQYGARIKPSKPPTQMTIAEIFAWIKATPRQPHAIGRYQFIPKTLDYLVTQLGIDRNQRFSPAVQDQLAHVLLQQAGLSKFRSGELNRRQFMNGLAKIWAGLPNSSGKSHYNGYAGNKATMTWARFDAQMIRIFGDA
ncbi:hypothetical protein [Actibacterium sp. 188UL27-1]|uniref:hypothetical protein n=1 Tax=Actibacterium sp. 188UL27-1 TaxID=2786961 RepID=UPI00195AECC4|nr:hypothetical protein [Actibacterium sp. 188UL27-1]MBM7069996.1 hypothetical protein [Actibacterium sp. 188UL27-1]